MTAGDRVEMLTPKYTGERGTVVVVLMIEVGGGRLVAQVWVDLDNKSVDAYGRGRCRDEGRDYPGVPWNDDSVRALSAVDVLAELVL